MGDLTNQDKLRLMQARLTHTAETLQEGLYALTMGLGYLVNRSAVPLEGKLTLRWLVARILDLEPKIYHKYKRCDDNMITEELFKMIEVLQLSQALNSKVSKEELAKEVNKTCLFLRKKGMLMKDTKLKDEC